MKAIANIRDAKSEEAELLTDIALRSKAHWGYSPELVKTCREEVSIEEESIRRSSFQYRVAEINSRVIGFYGLEKLANQDCELEGMFIEPAYIGSGVGRQLMEDAKKEALKSGASVMIIEGEPSVERFYKAAGGVKIGERESTRISGRFLPLFSVNLSVSKD